MNLRELFYSRMRSLGIYDLSKGTQSLICCEIESYLRVLEPLFGEIEWLRKNAVVSSCSPEHLAQYERMLAIPVKQQIPEEKRREIVQSKMAIGPSDFHREGIEQSLSALGIRAKVEEMPEKLSRLADGDYRLVKRGLLAADAPEGDWHCEAINDVVIFGETRMHPMDYRVYCDGSFVSSYRSDGLILATPTGSTAYSFSAGGPVLDGAADVMVLTPVCAHNVHTAPLVFTAGRMLEIVADAENRDNCYACADSGARHLMQPGQRLRVTAAPAKLQLITFQESEQFCAIENKLMRR